MIAAWLRAHFSYADVSESTLRATHAALQLSGLFARQREAIAQELVVRAWCAAIADQLEEERGCAWCDRGGIS